MKIPILTEIKPQDCIGLSRGTINSNFNTLSATTVDLWQNPYIAYPPGTLGAIRVGAGMSVTTSGALSLYYNPQYLTLNQGSISLIPSALSIFVHLSGNDTIKNSVVVQSQDERGDWVGVGVEASSDYKLNVEGSARFSGSIQLPSEGDVVTIKPGVGKTGGVVDYNNNGTIIQTAGISFRSRDDRTGVIFSGDTGKILTTGIIGTKSIVLGRNSAEITQTDSSLPLSFSNSTATCLRISKTGNVTIGTTAETTYKLEVIGTGNMPEIYVPNAKTGDRSRHMANTNFTNIFANEVNNLFTNALLKSGGEIAGNLTVTSFNTSSASGTSMLGWLATRQSRVATFNQESPLQIFTSGITPTLSINQASVGDGLVLNNTVSFDAGGNITATRTITSQDVRVQSGLPQSSQNNGFSFNQSTGTGVFRPAEGNLSLYHDNAEKINIDITKNTTTFRRRLSVTGVATQDNHLTNKKYIDDYISTLNESTSAAYAQAAEPDKVLLATGGTMTGALRLTAPITMPLNAVNRGYVTAAVLNTVASFDVRMRRSGDLMNGSLVVDMSTDNDLTVKSNTNNATVEVKSVAGEYLKLNVPDKQSNILSLESNLTNAAIISKNSLVFQVGTNFSLNYRTSTKVNISDLQTTINNLMVVNGKQNDAGGSVALCPAKSVSDSTINNTNNIVIDVYKNNIRFYENGATKTGAFASLRSSDGRGLVKLMPQITVEEMIKPSSELLDSRLTRSGDVMEGWITLPAPQSNAAAINKKYFTTALSGKANRAGDIMTGPLEITQEPIDGKHVVTKKYIDARNLTRTATAAIYIANALTLSTITYSQNANVPPKTLSTLLTAVFGPLHLLQVPQIPVSYQWYLGDTAVPGATLSSFAAKSNGDYRCEASNIISKATTGAINVLFNEQPTITLQPVSAPFITPLVDFTINATGVPSPTFKWIERSGAAWSVIPGGTNKTLTVNKSKTVRCIVSSGSYTLSSNAAQSYNTCTAAVSVLQPVAGAYLPVVGTNGAWSSFLNTYCVWHLAGTSYTEINVYFPQSGSYMFQLSIDNYGSMLIDGSVIINQPSEYGYRSVQSATTTVAAGYHKIRINAVNTGGPYSFAAAITQTSTNTMIWNTRMPTAVGTPGTMYIKPLNAGIGGVAVGVKTGSVTLTYDSVNDMYVTPLDNSGIRELLFTDTVYGGSAVLSINVQTSFNNKPPLVITSTNLVLSA